MSSQYLGANAIDSNNDQWLLTMRRRDGRTWTTRFYATTHELRAALKSAESVDVPAYAGILDLMLTETAWDLVDFSDFFGEYYSDAERVPTEWDHMFHKYILAQSEGLEQFLEGIDLTME